MDDWRLEPAKDVALSEPERWRSLRRESGLISTACHIAWWTGIRAYLSFWHRLRIIGRENLPAEPPFVLVSNHSSHLDALVLASPLPWRLRDRVFPIAAGDVFFEATGIAAFAALMVNALPMWRKKAGSKALRDLRQRLVEEPCGYILFPEGARSRDGKMLPFKNGLGMMVAQTSVPVIPCYLQGCFEALKPGRWLPRPRRISMRVGRPMTFADTSNDGDGWRSIGVAVRGAIEELAVK